MSNLVSTPVSAKPAQAQRAVDTVPVSNYTPAGFARFLAAKMVAFAMLPEGGDIRILDPAVGDGVLLHALVSSLPEQLWPRLQVFGFDANAEAIRIAASRLHRAYPAVGIHLEHEDFLAHLIEAGDAENLFADLDANTTFHFIIANPPHVRTRLMAEDETGRLAEHFGLTGSVDLYLPFLLGIAEVLAEDGTAGIIIDNSDLTSPAGQSVREALLTRFRLRQVWDLDDTALFDADAAPSVLVANGRMRTAVSGPAPSIPHAAISRTDVPAQAQADDLLAAFDAADDTVVALADGRRFRVRHGLVKNGDDLQAAWHMQYRSDGSDSSTGSTSAAADADIGKL